MRDRCRWHRIPFAVSLEQIAYCPLCRKDDAEEIGRLVRDGKLRATRTHALLLAEAEREQMEGLK